MNIVPIKAFVDNYIWCLENNDELYCVDPGDAQPIIDFMAQQRLILRGILLTHHHLDHIGGTERLVQQYSDISVFAPNDDRIVDVTHRVPDKQHCLPFGFQVIEIPGHTKSHIAYYQSEEHILFCGDTLFSAGCGRVFDGSIQQLYASLEILKALPDETRVYCGHEYTQANLRFALHVEPDNQVAFAYLETLKRAQDPCSLPSTIGLEKQINPFFRLNVASIVKTVSNNTDHQLASFEIFERIREAKNAWCG